MRRPRFAPPGPRRPAVAAAILAALVVGVVGACGGQPSPTPTVPPPATASPLASATSAARPSPSPSPAVEPTPDPSVLVGTDGRLTVLLLGSDYRAGHAGNRTDMIMVVSIDPTSGGTAVLSVPRDTARFPMPDGSVYAPKVNGLYQHLAADVGWAEAGPAMKGIIGKALDLEIDWYAVVGFDGTKALIDSIGGVDVNVPKTINDPSFYRPGQGVYFKAGPNHFDGDRALEFARTRKADNDYERARRQQLLVAAIGSKVLERGVAVVPGLVDLAARHARTDLPLADAAEIYEIVSGADLATRQRVVFGPRSWADGITAGSIKLKIDRVREWVDKAMPAAGPAPVAMSEAP